VCAVAFLPGVLLLVADRTDFRLPNRDIGSSTLPANPAGVGTKVYQLVLKSCSSPLTLHMNRRVSE